MEPPIKSCSQTFSLKHCCDCHVLSTVAPNHLINIWSPRCVCVSFSDDVYREWVYLISQSCWVFIHYQINTVASPLFWITPLKVSCLLKTNLYIHKHSTYDVTLFWAVFPHIRKSEVWLWNTKSHDMMIRDVLLSWWLSIFYSKIRLKYVCLQLLDDVCVANQY